MAVRQDLARAAIARVGRPTRHGRDGNGAGHYLGRHRQHGARAFAWSACSAATIRATTRWPPFGGAGPLHAARLAKELDISRILVPRNPGILCAMGLLLTDLRADFATTTRLMTLGRAITPERWKTPFATLRRGCGCLVRGRGRSPHGSQKITRTVDMRYAGQNYELPISLPDGPVDAGQSRSPRRGVRRRASRVCTASSPRARRCNWSPSVSRPPGWCARHGSSPKPRPGRTPPPRSPGHRDVWLPEAGGFVSCPVYDRERLQAGNRIAGPGNRRADGHHDAWCCPVWWPRSNPTST